MITSLNLKEMNDPSLEIIFGPMFSGKSTELLRRLNICSVLGFRTLYINSNLDERSDEDFSTHNPSIKSIGKMDSTKMDFDLSSEKINEKIGISSYSVIGIDEAQLFKNLETTVIELVEKYKVKVIIAGLSGDFRRKKFGEVIDLIPYADKVDKLNSMCPFCSKKNGMLVEAPFTKRLGNSRDTILIGGNTEYAATCRKCYSTSD